jgi:hypothetical protein
MMDSSRDYTKENDSPFDADSKQTTSGVATAAISAPTRGPLSWQRRPQSQASDRRKSRPLSVVAAENAASRTSTPAEPSPSEQNPSRDQIAQALAGKDPNWFRQTADRGQGSAALRRNQVEDSDTLDMASLRAQLPGMSRESPSQPLREAAEIRPASPGTRAKLGSPLILSPAQRLEPPTPEASSQKEITAGGRTSPTRPLSPTKGMGGFVQSAMMKRSDSVKRWSVNSPAGLQRADSVVSNRSSIDNTHRTSTTLSHSRQNSMLRDGSVTPTRSSRPTSRGTTTPTSRPTTSHDQQQDMPDKGSRDDEKPVTEDKAQEDEVLPMSPSKTMDPRRWSPTKSSWLDAALNKPESPKPKPTPPSSQQPAWMVELNKSKAQKSNIGSPDVGATSPVARRHEVKTGGLMKSSPMGAGVKPAPIGASTLSPRLPSGDKPAIGGLRSNLTRQASNKSEPEGAAPSSIPTKTKPRTPPKKDPDFRGNLKPRQAPSGAGASEAPDELKNVFGKLRRTQTQNYKAPDELKNNILRGKAALNVTGGPKPSDRKDEFKEAILKKKEEFKKAQDEGRSIAKAPKPTDEKPIPEGLLKTMEMKRSGTISKRDSATSDVPPDAPSGTKSNRPSTISSVSRSDSAGTTQIPARKPSVSTENEPPAGMPTLHKEVSAPGRLQGRAAAGGLAGRFNPALAGILARGPPGVGSGAPKGSAGSTPQTTSGGAEPEASPGPGPQLTHMTKNRARGPKRKAPSTLANTTNDAKAVEQAPAAKTPTPPQQEKFESRPETAIAAEPVKLDKPVAAPKPQVVSLVDSSKTLAQKEKPTSAAQVISLVDSSKKKPVEEEPAPSGQPISFAQPTLSRARTRSIHEKVAALVAQTQPTAKPAATDEITSQPPSPRKLNVKRISKFLDDPVQVETASDAPKARTPSPTKLGRFAFEADAPSDTSRPLPPSPTRSRPLPVPTTAGPSRTPSADDKVDSEPVVSVKNAKNLFGGAAAKSPEISRFKPVPASPKPAAESQRPRTPPNLSSRALPPPPEAEVASPPMSPMTKYNREISAVLTSFFGPERPKRTYNADAADILMRRPTAGSRVKTQQAQLYQVSGDGKKQPVAAHNERVLFEREMYLCPHTFTNEAGKKVTEVYFWAGDEVSESAVQDAQVFLQREARSFGGKLVKLTQGKETPEFIQALGGIVIVRRGSSNKYDSLAPNMLCGRRYHGQIAFDEVDFSPSSLCSGFPYLITQQGKCFLWKGKGSDVDELSCARLIGMDLALMGELEEVEDGNEPDRFWRIFDGGSRLGSADHWRLKPNYDKYCGRLFKSDAADRKQVSLQHPSPSLNAQGHSY